MVVAARTTSQILLHMGLAFTVMWTVTGSTAFGGVAALIEPLGAVLLMPLHDRLWERLQHAHERGQRRTAPPGVPVAQ